MPNMKSTLLPGTRRITIDVVLPERLIRELDEVAKHHRRSRNGEASVALAQYVERQLKELGVTK